MSRKVLDSHMGDNEVDTIMNNIIAQNPQLNAQIEMVHNESNVFLCKILRIYSYEDKVYVKILNTGENIFARVSHEVMGSNMSIDYLPKGLKNTDDEKFKGKDYIVPYDDLYGIVIKVRWLNLDDENVLLSYVNIHDKGDLKTTSDDGELFLKSGSSSISVDDERINIMTPHLFINGLPYNEPDLKNYYDKDETNIITKSLEEMIKSNTGDTTPSGNIDLSNYEVDFDMNFGLSGYDSTINIKTSLVEKTNNTKEIWAKRTLNNG